MLQLPLVLHGPANSPTGISYAKQYLTRELRALGYSVESWSPGNPVQLANGTLSYPKDPTWTIKGFHFVIDQPMLLDPAYPWHGCMPFFELPLRPDEQQKLKLTAPRLVCCSNPWMQSQLIALNPNIDPGWFPLVTLGADPLLFDVTRITGSVITVGKAEPRKGTRILLQVLKELKLSGYLAITSPLHTQPELERLQDYADAGNHTLLNFMGAHEEIFALLQSCHVAVFPASAEGFGLCVTEAIAQGCVVVASDIPAFRYQYEILREAVGPEETDARMILVPTQMVPMTPHQRWYPSVLYPGVQWPEVTVDDLKVAITKALQYPFPRAWEPGEFPLTWKHAAERLSSAIENRPILNKQRRAVFGSPESKQ